MVRLGALLTATALVVTSTGCSLDGSWETVSVDPPTVPFPLDTITFDANKNYTASWTQDGSPRTGTGQYQWNGSTLDVVQGYTLPRTYRTRKRLDGTLELTYEQGGAKVSAILQRQAE